MERTILALAVFVGLIGAREVEAEERGPIPIIDTHIHLYDPTRPEGVPWPPEGDKVLYRPVLADDFETVAKENRLAATVIVEASDWVADNQWVLDLTAHAAERFIGLVGSLELGSDSFGDDLATLAKDERFVGIRLRERVGGESYFERDEVWRDLKALSDAGLALDVLMFQFTLEEVAMIGERLPDLPILINHVAGAAIDGEAPDEAWLKGIAAAAAQPNVRCKVSGLFQQSGQRPSPKGLAFYRSTLDALWEAFGADRLIYGSNWPVSDHGGTYGEYKRIVMRYLDEKGRASAEKVLYKNALDFYKIPASRMGL